MEKFEYLPRLIIAYDGNTNDKSANLIHIEKSEQNKNYYCPCCGNVVKPRAIDSNKVQPHYYHINGDCDIESQIHWFYKHWLFENGSKFKVEDKEITVKLVEIEKTYKTPFGDYRPDITVTDINEDIYYFEIFFTNGKRKNDYFCKWKYLNNPVIQVEIKEYMIKQQIDEIPEFKYLYNNGKCYCKEYRERDVYINTIQKRINQLSRQEIMDYKSRIAKLDYFWQLVIDRKSDDELINTILDMEFDDAAFCYEMVKKQQCVKYLTDVVLEALNKKTLEAIKKKIDLPYDKNVYLGLYKYSAKTYEIGIIIDIDEPDIHINTIHKHCCDWYACNTTKTNLNNIDGFPKVVFKNKLFTESEIDIPEEKVQDLKDAYESSIEYKNKIYDIYNNVKNTYSDIKLCFNNNRIDIYLNDDGIIKIGEFNTHDFGDNLNEKDVYSEIKKLRNRYFKKKEFDEYFESIKNEIYDFEVQNNCKITVDNQFLRLRYDDNVLKRKLTVGNIYKVLKAFTNAILDWDLRINVMNECSQLINSRAKIWRTFVTQYNRFYINLIDPETKETICYKMIYNDWESKDEFVCQVNKALEQLLWDAEYYHGIRFMEGR